MISYEDFKKLEIKIGRIISAEKVEGADKSLKLVIDLGLFFIKNTKQQMVAGIAQYYTPFSTVN